MGIYHIIDASIEYNGTVAMRMTSFELVALRKNSSFRLTDFTVTVNRNFICKLFKNTPFIIFLETVDGIYSNNSHFSIR